MNLDSKTTLSILKFEGFCECSNFLLSILFFELKALTAHRRWQVYRGDSTSSSNMLFSVKKSSLLQFKTELDVFLAGNTSEHVCDFKIKGSWLERSCIVYAGNTNAIIAQVITQNS